MPKISFLSPIYNKAAYVAETIRSLQNQTLEDIEIIFLDDGSTDDTPEVIKFFMEKDKRIRLYRFKKNKGLGKGWNYITQKATAPIICVASGDDIYAPKRAEITHDYFEKNLNADVFYGSFWFCDYIMRRTEYKPAIPFNKKKLLTPRKDGFCPQYIGHLTLAYRIETARNVPYRKKLRVGIDYPFLVDLANYGCCFGWTKKTLAEARLLNTGVSIARRKEVIDASKI
jgi:glycosyltransferase involved in cell wall biosynthesis